MLGLARTALDGSSDLGFAEPFGKKWKQDRSCLSELGGMQKQSAYNRSYRTEAKCVCGVIAQMMRSFIPTGRFLKSPQKLWR